MKVTEDTMITITMTGEEHTALMGLLDDYADTLNRATPTGATPGYRDQLDDVRFALHRPPPG